MTSAASTLPDPNDERLRKTLDAHPDETAVDAAARLVDELLSWRSGCEAAFGIITANPHATLVRVASAEVKHHREHHERERLAWNVVQELAERGGFPKALAMAKEALAALDEQGMPG